MFRRFDHLILYGNCRHFADIIANTVRYTSAPNKMFMWQFRYGDAIADIREYRPAWQILNPTFGTSITKPLLVYRRERLFLVKKTNVHGAMLFMLGVLRLQTRQGAPQSRQWEPFVTDSARGAMATLFPRPPQRHWRYSATSSPVITMPPLPYVVWRDPLSTNALGRVESTGAYQAESAKGDHGVIDYFQEQPSLQR